MGTERGIPEDVPLDLVANEKSCSTHNSSKQISRHVWSGAVPSGSLSLIGNGIYVFTPAVCLLQIAGIAARFLSGKVDKEYQVVVIAQLGCELCGQYSISETARDGHIWRLPLTSVGELAHLVEGNQGMYGAKQLREAIPWIIDNLRSPAETSLFLIMCVRPAIGGYGLPLPLSNFDIDVKGDKTGFFDGWMNMKCTVDFYWPQARLVVEYDSDAHHPEDDEAKTEHDSQRADALRALGYIVVTIRHDGLYKPKRLRAKMEEIASYLQEGLPEATAAFIAANNVLRNVLLYSNRWV